MSPRRKLLAEQVAWVRDVAAKRAEARRQLALLPKLQDIAAQLGVSHSCLKQLLTNRSYRT